MPRATAASTRDRILDVTADLMRTGGLTAVTTREIARAAGLTEAALYRHFKNKEDLLTSALAERSPVFVGILNDLPQQVGQATVAENLRRVAEAAVPFYRQALPMLSAILGDPNLRARHREWASETGRGPQRANTPLSAYLRGERERARISANFDTDAAAALLLGACLQRALFDEFYGRLFDGQAIAEYAAALVETLLSPAE
ncbi:MAG: TetR/AcrR family transcriptional regulator [Chloroflexi bacterium]|nr:TetR/AcrR family transcriptional regulator [Chloroflexota bacterium]